MHFTLNKICIYIWSLRPDGYQIKYRYYHPKYITILSTISCSVFIYIFFTLTIFTQGLNKLFESVIACFCMRNYMHTPEYLCVLGPQHNSHLYQIRPLEIWYHIPYIYFTVSNRSNIQVKPPPPQSHIFSDIANWNWEKSMLAISYWGQRLAEHEVIGVKFFLLLP